LETIREADRTLDEEGFSGGSRADFARHPDGPTPAGLSSTGQLWMDQDAVRRS
jgi:hypothetical protein